MNLKNMLELRGINVWHIANCVGWNLIGTGAALVLIYYFLTKNPKDIVPYQVFLIASVFIVSFSGGFVFGRLASDGRGLTYGVVGSLGSIILSIFLVVPSGGILGLMLVFIAMAGGLNGGLFSIQRRKK
jgi:hypothetical protein